MEQSRYWHPKLPNIIFCFFKKDFVYEETPESQKLKVWHHVLRRSNQNWSYQTSRYNAWKRVATAIERWGRAFVQIAPKLKNFELAHSFKHFSDLVRDHWRYTWVQESSDVFGTKELPGLLKRELPKLTTEQLNDIAIALSAPKQLSFMEEQHQALLRLAIRGYGSVRKTASLHKVSSEFKERIASFANHYLWLLSNYREGRPFNSGTVWQQLRHLCQNKSKRELQQELRSLGTKVRRAAGLRSMVLQQYKLSTDLRAAFRLLCWWAGWIDQRKHTALIVNWYLEAYARAIARRLSRPLWQVKYMTTEEAVAGLKRGVLPTMSALAARRKFSVYVVVREHNGVRDEFITGVSAGRLWRAIFKKQGSEIKGQVASAPVSRLKGVVQVVLDPHRDNFKTGRILVTTMTRPDFVTIMRRASAIVTDEGGITSHAAIIARELGVTCIIGTKTASKILKTGDKVELDLRQGKVRKL